MQLVGRHRWMRGRHPPGQGPVRWSGELLHKPECDFYDLLDEAYALSLSVRLDTTKAPQLLSRLRECANHARAAGMIETHQKLESAASDLERRIASEQQAG